MCGLVGFIGGVSSVGNDEGVLRSMADTIVHRGPDDSGVWCDSEWRIGLGLRRLAIMDLSPAGHQPMISPSGRYVIAFNGEIYNHMELRRELGATTSIGVVLDDEQRTWRGCSDTETLLAGFDAWGIDTTIERSLGMFAIAIWDRHSHELCLVRDRVGEKPLYFGWQGDYFLFGSELKALRAHPAFRGEINRDALCLYLRHGYVPTPYSIYKGISKLEPGCLLTISLRHPEPKRRLYWSMAQIASAGVANPYMYKARDAIDELEILLKDAVRQQMVAEVPLGAFLSGGVDSSTVVSLMQAQSPRPVKTFTIGFHEAGYSEAAQAKAVARHLGTEHTEMYVTADQAMAVISRLPLIYDEPFADSSQIPTFLVSQLARQTVTVSLSGDGGDELFCGYNRYQLTSKLWKQLAFVPKSMRHLAAKGITAVSPQTWNRYAGFLPWASVGDMLHKGAGVMTSASAEELYRGMVSSWTDPANLVIDGVERPTLLTEYFPSLTNLDDVQRMMALDAMTYLPDDILVKMDRATMAASLESRAPLLDHRVVEFSWRLPMALKLRAGITKWALRQVLYRYVPRSLIERPKMGFGFPIDQWLRGPLRRWAEELLNEQRLDREGFFRSALIRQRWTEHLSGSRNWSSQLWGVLMFQTWLEQASR